MNKELTKKMINPFFTDRALQFGFKISLDCHHVNHSNSKIDIKLISSDSQMNSDIITESEKRWLLFIPH